MASDDEFQNRLLQQLTTLLESQRSLNSGLSKVVEREADFDAEFAKLSRQVHSLRENLVDIRSDTSGLRSDTSILRSDVAKSEVGVPGSSDGVPF